MARHPPQSHIALFDHAWLVIVLFGALSGCGTNSVATNSVNVRAENLNAPTVGRARALATVSATSIEEISVPGPSPSEAGHGKDDHPTQKFDGRRNPRGARA